MPNKMLIDAVHREETRVVVLRDGRVEEFDFEAANKRQLRGNIYLAKVTRVEPSLQAAFVDYGGNRHGFLAFSEIHPDYYQIPVADRQELLRQEQEAEEALAQSEDAPTPTENEIQNEPADTHEPRGEEPSGNGDDAVQVSDFDADAASEASEETAEAAGDEKPGSAESVTEENGDDPETGGGMALVADTGAEETLVSESEDDEDADETGNGAEPEVVGSEDAMEETPVRRAPRPRPYKIQEVIKRRQVLLVQVVKEERGNKGAALTTYLSLAGRYSVLMPNTARGGGISRKISNATDRARLKTIASELDVPDGMGVILRTAGASRTKTEVKRDFEYLMRLWEKVRTTTLDSTAPMLVYEEGSLVKRAIRDLYTRDIEEVLVSGEEDYREAKEFMRMLMPSHAKNVRQYKEQAPIFVDHRIEPQLEALFNPQITLKSGGYIVINQTEALVAIDVNSGRATKEHNIEDTALKTNLEAASEISRQLRLRDLAGLIVIDFIDMEERRNNRTVERRLKEALKTDRARIQVGRISSFGLLEMSRQRIRSGVLEGSTELCPHCHGTGLIRSTESVALHVLRAIEARLYGGSSTSITVRCATSAALYILNYKRPYLRELEETFGILINFEGDENYFGTNHMIEESDSGIAVPVPAAVVQTDVADTDSMAADDDEGGQRRKRRRRRRRGRSSDQDVSLPADEALEAAEEEDEGEGEKDEDQEEQRASEDEEQPRSRRRRGGRRRRRRTSETAEEPKVGADPEAVFEEAVAIAESDAPETTPDTPEAIATAHEAASDEMPEGSPEMPAPASGSDAEEEAGALPNDETAKPARRRRARARSTEAAAAETNGRVREMAEAVSEAAVESEVTVEPDADAAEDTTPRPVRRGWWQRRLTGRR